MRKHQAEEKGGTVGQSLHCSFHRDVIYNLYKKHGHILHLTGLFVLHSHCIIGFLMHCNIKNDVKDSN